MEVKNLFESFGNSRTRIDVSLLTEKEIDALPLVLAAMQWATSLEDQLYSTAALADFIVTDPLFSQGAIYNKRKEIALRMLLGQITAFGNVED